MTCPFHAARSALGRRSAASGQGAQPIPPRYQGAAGRRIRDCPGVRAGGPRAAPVRGKFRRRRGGGVRHRQRLRAGPAGVRPGQRKPGGAARRAPRVHYRAAGGGTVHRRLRLRPELLAIAALPGAGRHRLDHVHRLRHDAAGPAGSAGGARTRVQCLRGHLPDGRHPGSGGRRPAGRLGAACPVPGLRRGAGGRRRRRRCNAPPAAACRGRRRGPAAGADDHARGARGQHGFRAPVVSAFTNGWATFGVRMSLIPLFAGAVLLAGPSTAGLALAVFAVGNAVALTFSGRLADTLGRKPMVVTGLVVTGLALGAVGFTDNVPLFVAFSVVAGFGSGLLNPSQQAAVADVIGNQRNGGKVLAGFQMATDAGTILGPILAGALADRFSYGLAFAVTGGISLAAALVWLLFGRETLMKPVKEAAAD